MLLSSLLIGLRSQAVMQAEIIALRHQLTVLQRNQPKRLVLNRALPVGLVVTVVVGLALLSNHREARNRNPLVSLVLDLEDSSRAIGTPSSSERTRDLIRTMSRENLRGAL